MKSGYLSKVTTTVTRTCRCKAQKLHRRKITSGYASLEEALTKVGFHQCKNWTLMKYSYLMCLICTLTSIFSKKLHLFQCKDKVKKTCYISRGCMDTETVQGCSNRVKVICLNKECNVWISVLRLHLAQRL